MKSTFPTKVSYGTLTKAHGSVDEEMGSSKKESYGKMANDSDDANDERMALLVSADARSPRTNSGPIEWQNDPHHYFVSVEIAVERVGTGAFQRKMLLAVGLCFMTESMEYSFLRVLSTVLREEWSLSEREVDAISAVTFVGSMLGAVILGQAGDKVGRMPVLAAASILIAIANVATAFCSGFPPMLVARCCAGFGIGAMSVPFDALGEFLPTATRGHHLLLIGFFRILGLLMVPAVAYIALDTTLVSSMGFDFENRWQFFVILCSVPSFLATSLVPILVPESPRWLLEKNRSDSDSDSCPAKALEILKSAARSNGISQTEINADLFPPNTKLVVSLQEVENDANTINGHNQTEGSGDDSTIKSNSTIKSTISSNQTEGSGDDSTIKSNSTIKSTISSSTHGANNSKHKPDNLGKFRELFRTPHRTRITILLWLTWFGFGFLNHGIDAVNSLFITNGDEGSFFLSHYGDDSEYGMEIKFDSIVFTASADFLGLVIVLSTIDSVGRIPTQTIAYCIGGASTFALGISYAFWMNASYSSNDTNYSFRHSFLFGMAFLSRMALMASSSTIWLSTSEILPTKILSTGHGAATAIAQLGGFVALGLTKEGCPIAAIGILILLISFTTAECSKRLPETAGKPMASTDENDDNPHRPERFASRDGMEIDFWSNVHNAVRPLILRQRSYTSVSSAEDDEGSHSATSNDASSISQLSSQGSSIDVPGKRSDRRAIKVYFMVWNVCTALAFVFNIYNMDWQRLVTNESWSMVFFASVFVLVQGVLQWSVIEIPLMSFATLLVKPIPDQKSCGKDLTVIINYNLLASYEAEVDATLKNAYDAYVGNLSPSVVAVMVSATGKEELKNYELEVRDECRTKIHDLVLAEGIQWANGNAVDTGRATRCFEQYRNISTREIDASFLEVTLPSLAKQYAKNFMVIQRVSRSLRKCGQYQDLMLLSEGCNEAWTYTDDKLYNTMARKYGEHVFYPSEDVDNAQGREFEYTLVLDGDTGVVKDSLSDLMDIAAASPDRAILQPSLKITARDDQSVFMHIDKMRKEINEPVSAALTTLLGRSGYYGKGLIKNKLYIRIMLGDQDNPIEKVPIDVLSHDTFEAAALSPLYANSVHLLEEPCGNYVTWDIRECRWNRGELILSHYFFPRMGRWFTWLMHKVREKPPMKLTLRTDTLLDEAGAYIAHSALRQMLLKPTLLLYIVGQSWIKTYLRYHWVVFWVEMFTILIVPKIPIVRWNNLHKVLVETICSVFQFTPEPILGTYRVYRACKAHVTGVSGWIPQFKVEQDFRIRPAVIATVRYQWWVLLASISALVPIYIFKPEAFLLQYLFVMTAVLPIYTTLTALPYTLFKRHMWLFCVLLCAALALIVNESQEQRLPSLFLWGMDKAAAALIP